MHGGPDEFGGGLETASDDLSERKNEDAARRDSGADAFIIASRQIGDSKKHLDERYEARIA